MEVISLIAILALGKKLVDLLKYVRAADWNASITQVVTWIAFVGILALAGAADVSSGIEVFAGQTLGSLDFASLVLAGLIYGSASSVVLVDFRKAIDRSDSAKTPPLLPEG